MPSGTRGERLLPSALLSTAAGIVLLFIGAEALVRGSASAATRLGVAPLIIGLTVVAFGTSAPELAVSVDAALAGQGAVAAGNVVGSNIGNIGLILGLAALIRPLAVHAQVIRRDVPVAVLATLLLVMLLFDGRLVRWEGLVLLTGLVAYTAASLRLAWGEGPAVQDAFAVGNPMPSGSVTRDILFIAAGLIVLVLGARLLVTGAIGIAEGLGVSDAVIALIVIAIGTSLPELATSLVAALKRQGDIAVGNIVGSNIFNALGILGIAAAVRPLDETGMQMIDLVMLVGMSVVVLPIMRTGARVTRGEGIVLLVAYASYVVYLMER